MVDWTIPIIILPKNWCFKRTNPPNPQKRTTYYSSPRMCTYLHLRGLFFTTEQSVRKMHLLPARWSQVLLARIRHPGACVSVSSRPHKWLTSLGHLCLNKSNLEFFFIELQNPTVPDIYCRLGVMDFRTPVPLFVSWSFSGLKLTSPGTERHGNW